MRRTVKQNKAAAKPAKKASSPGVTFYGPDRATVSCGRERGRRRVRGAEPRLPYPLPTS